MDTVTSINNHQSPIHTLYP